MIQVSIALPFLFAFACQRGKTEASAASLKRQDGIEVVLFYLDDGV